jgi:hypothetical protein
MNESAEQDASEQIEENPDAVDRKEEKGETSSFFSRPAFLRRNLLIGGLIILAAVFGGISYMALIRFAGPGPTTDPEETVISQEVSHSSPHRLIQQDLSPFYVPLSGEESGRIARVSFSVTWDKTASKRFQDRETLARDRIYLRMTELAGGGKNMRDMSPTVRVEAQKILDELLRPDVLRVVVTGIAIV